MRVVFLLLLLGNLAFFAWAQFLRTPLSAEAHIQQVQMTPEKIRIVSAPAGAATRTPTATEGAPARALTPEVAQAPAIAPAREPTAKLETEKAPAACLAWGVFIGPQDAGRADAAMAEAKLPPAQVRRVLSDADGHWVLIAPQKTQADIARTIENLKQVGITDHMVVTEPAQWRNAISLGIFRTEDAARALLADLQKKGVADVTLARRERFFQQVIYLIREPDDALVARLATLRQRVPGSEVKAIACPVG